MDQLVDVEDGQASAALGGEARLHAPAVLVRVRARLLSFSAKGAVHAWRSGCPEMIRMTRCVSTRCPASRIMAVEGGASCRRMVLV